MKKLALAAVCASLVLGGGGAAQADTVKLNMPSTFPGSLIQLGQAGVRLQDTINTISGGEIEVKFFEPKALVPPLEILMPYRTVPWMRAGRSRAIGAARTQR